MQIHRCFAIWSSALLICFLFVSVIASQAQGKGKTQYACDEPNPASLCNAGNTCGSASTPCSVDVKKDGKGATATPSIPGAKGNSLFCVQKGTTVTWTSSNKNTGFLIDFGPDSPFDYTGSLIGGASKPVSVIAEKEGCYKYSVGGCYPGAIYGMCGSGAAEAVVIAAPQ